MYLFPHGMAVALTEDKVRKIHLNMLNLTSILCRFKGYG